MFLIFKQTFYFAFQSSFVHYFLIVRTIIFTLFILFIYLKSYCQLIVTYVQNKYTIFKWCWMKTNSGYFMECVEYPKDI